MNLCEAMNIEGVVKQNRRVFEGVLTRIQNEKDIDNKVKLAFIALDQALVNPSEYYSSHIIEDVFCEVAQSINVQLCEEIQKDSCLIVMSEAYQVGGHTRVVERWIEADTGIHYSLALTRLSLGTIPSRLKEDIDRSGGKIFSLNCSYNWKEAAISLRQIASRYEKVLLFTHMNDYIPLVAFGTEDFKRPVGFYNHADHLFSLGVSISDAWGELRKWGQMVTARYRGIIPNSIISVPFETQEILRREKKHEIREKLGLPLTAKIVMTAGGLKKLYPSSYGDLSNLFVPILSSDKQVHYYIIGLEGNEIETWIQYKVQFGERLVFVPAIPHPLLMDYFYAADLVVDSYPEPGITTLQDAILCQCPILSRTDSIDWLTTDTGYCESDCILVQNAKRLLYSDDSAKQLWSVIINAVKNECGSAVFRARINTFMTQLSLQTHKIHHFESMPTGCIPMDIKLAESKQRGMMVYRKALLRQIRPYWVGDLFYKSYLLYIMCSNKLKISLGLSPHN